MLLAVVLFAAGLFGLHRLQAGNITGALLWQANQAEKSGNPNLAARYLSRYLEFVPEDIEEREHLANVLSDDKLIITAGAMRRAEYAINQVLTWDPQRHKLRLVLCRILLATQRPEQAEEHLKVLQNKLPESGDVAFLTGQWRELRLQTQAVGVKKDEQQRLLREIRSDYERAIRLDPRKAGAYLRLVAVLRQQDFGKDQRENVGEIDRTVAAALRNLPDDAGVLSLAAQRAQEKGDTASARKYLEAGLKQDPNEPRLYQALARLHNQLGNRAEAIAQLKRGLEAVGKERQGDLHWTLANLLLDDEQFEPARKIISQIRGVHALSADYLDARGMMYQGRWYDAARTLERLRPALKAVAELTLQVDIFLGLCYQKIDEPLRALSAYDRAASADPTSLAAQHGKTMALWRLGQRDEALQRLRQLIEGNTNRGEANRWRVEYARMLMEAQLGRDPEIGQKLAQLLEDAEKGSAQAVECALLRAVLLFAEKKVEQAQAELHRVIQAAPKRFEPWLALAELAMETRQPQQAGEILEQAGKHVDDTAEFRLARIQFASRYRKDSVDLLNAAEKDLGQFSAKQQARLLESLAEVHFRANRPTEAVRLLRQMAALPPHAEDVRVRMMLLSLALAQNDETEAQRVLGEVKKIEGEPATEWSYGEALRLIGRARRAPTDEQKSLLDQSRTLLNTAASRRPDWPAVFLARGEVDELDHKPEQAIVSYRKALDLGSRDPHGVYQLLQLLSNAQRFDEAEQLIRKMDQVGIGTNIGRQLVFDFLLQGQDYKTATQIGKRVVQQDSKNYRDHLLQGQLLSAGGRLSAEAETAFRRAVALAERQPETWVALVRYLGSTGQFAKALEEIASAEPKLDADVRYVALASCHEVLGTLDEAEKMYRKAMAEQPRSARVHRTAADFFLRFGKVRDAEKLYRDMLDGKLGTIEGEPASIRRSLALALARSGDPQRGSEALKLVGLGVDADGNLQGTGQGNGTAASTEHRLTQARVLAALGSHALRGEAAKQFESLHQKQALPIEDQYQLAYLLHLDGSDPANWSRARDILNGITTSQPFNARFLAFHANLRLLHKEVAEAEALITRLEQLEHDRKLPPGLLGSVELKARSLELRGKEQQAIALVQDFARQKEAPRSRTLLLAGLLGRAGSYEEAVDRCYDLKPAQREEAYGAAIGLLRAGKPASSQSAKLQRWQQQMDRVESDLRASVSLDEDNLVLRLQLADLLELQGRFDQSEAVSRDVLKKDADNLVALNNLAWMLAHGKDQAREALTLVDRAIARHGARPELLDTRAVVNLNLGNVQGAVRDLEKVVRDAPTPTRYFHLSRAHHLAKNAPQALAALRRANDLGLNVQQLHPKDQELYPVLSAELQKQP
jgi:tetratricopeptide (TPR) repeat protein